MPICQACGHPNPDDASSCELCGTPLDSRPGVGGTRPPETERTEFKPGETIADRYLVVRELGRGGMGVVYQVRDTAIENRMTALKLIRPELVAHPEARQRFVREVAIGLDLHHPNIVHVYDLKQRDRLMFYTMEYVEGRRLREWMVGRKGQVPPFTLAETAAVIGPLLDALEYAHKKTIHRDVKPENIMVTGAFPQVGVKVLDFGIAKTLSASSFTRTAHAMGTAYYMSPEQLAGSADIDLRSDLYAVGMVLYEMLTGRMAVGRFKLPCEIVPDLPAVVDDLVDKALASLPADRFQTDEAFRQALAASVANDDRRSPSTARQSGAESDRATKPATPPSGDKDARPSNKADPDRASTRKPETPPGEPRPQSGPAKKPPADPGRRPPIRALLAALLLVLAAIGGWYGYAQFLSKAVLDVTSTPSGASVWVDGQEAGKTPLRLDSFEEGPHQVRLELDRYAPHEGSVILAKGESRSFEGRLEPLPIGDVTIRSTPAGARVLLDGEEKGETPLTLERLPAGRHEVVLQAEGYDPWRSPVEIVALQTAVIEADLATVYGALAVTSEPPGAEVLLDGKKVGVTPSEVETVHKGEHKIELRLADHDPWRETVEVGAGRKNEIAAKLIPIYGGLKVTSTPSKAKVLLDGKTVGETPAEVEKVHKGKHEIALRLADHDPWKKTVDIGAGRKNEVTATLESSYGGLQVTSEPSKAQVVLDGQTVGETPLTLDRVKKGKRHVKVSKSGYKGWEDTITVRAGEVALVEAGLSLSQGGLKVTSTPSGATVYIDGREQGRTPVTIDGLSPGQVKVRVIKAFFDEWNGGAEVAAGRTVSVTAQLEPQARWKDSKTGMEFAWIAPGRFEMGQSDSEKRELIRTAGQSDYDKHFADETRHRVTLTQGFYLQTTEVTVGQWRSFVKATGYKSEAEKGDGSDVLVFETGKWEKQAGRYWDSPGFGQTDRHPVTCVSWNDAQALIRWLNGKGEGRYRLPTEAEWEYAARAGTVTSRFWGDDPAGACRYANVLDKSANAEMNQKYNRHWKKDQLHDCEDGHFTTAPVGSYQANPWGLYDMIGNVWEWCQDWYGDYPSAVVTDPTGASSGSARVDRGGSWNSSPRNCRSANRYRLVPGNRINYLGFRLALSPVR